MKAITLDIGCFTTFIGGFSLILLRKIIGLSFDLLKILVLMKASVSMVE